MADSNSSAKTSWKKKRGHSSKIMAAREAQNRTSNKSGERSSMDRSGDSIRPSDEDHTYDSSKRQDSPIFEIEGESFSTLFDSPIKKRSNVVHSTPMVVLSGTSQMSDSKETINRLKVDLRLKSQELAETKAELIVSKRQILELNEQNSEFKNLVDKLKTDVINLESRVSSKVITDHLFYSEKEGHNDTKVLFKENGKVAIIHSNLTTNTCYFATMDPSMSYASLTRQRDKKRRLNILRDFLEHLSKGDATTDIGKLLGDFLLDNPPIAQHIFQNFHNGIPFCLSASDSLDFKLALGLSWNDYRKIKCFMTKLNFDFLAPTNKAIVETSNRKVKSDLKFTYILLTEKDEKVERPLLVVSNLIDFIEECWADTIKNGELAEDDPRFEKKVWIAIGGDNGGKTTKLTLSIINVMKPNSIHNTRIIGFYEGADKADNIRTAFTHLSDQVRQIQHTMTLPYPLADGVFEQRKIKLFLVGDTMFLSYFNGHQGPSSSYPCLFCLIQLGDLKRTGSCKLSGLNQVSKIRNIFPQKLGNSQVQYPLFPIDLENIVPPVLHIPLGLFNDIFKQIRILCKKIDLTKKFNLDLGTSKDVMSKEMSIPALTSAILTRIQELSNEIKFLEEDLDVYKRLKAMLTTCIDNKVKPARLSKHCCSAFCFSSSPFFKQHCNNWLYCKKCPNMTHMVCALVLTQHQMSLIKPDDFECFECKGQNNLSCILQTCNNIEETLKNNLVSLKRSYNENSTHADKLTENLERSQGSCEKELFSALDALGVDLKAYHSGSFVGNHIFRMLKINEEINGPQLLTECLKSQSDHRKLFYDILVLLGEIFNLTTKTGFLSDVEINNISQLCRALKEMMIKKFPDWTTTVKLHMLTDHVPNFVKKHQSCGSFSEQGIESLHAQMNHIRRFFVMRGPSKYMPLIFQHHHLLASVKDSQRFLPKKRISTKSTCDNFDDQITCDNPAVEDRLSDDDFEVEY